jgi:hypothetical protein
MKKFFLFLLFSNSILLIKAQHQHHQVPPVKDTLPLKQKKQQGGDSVMQHPAHNMSTAVKHNMHHKVNDDEMNMSHSFSKSLLMNRNSSGTAWLPDDAPMYGYMKHGGKWMYMFHGNIFLRYTSQDVFNKGSRGSTQFDAPNWFMAMGQKTVGRKGLFRFSAMLSLDRLTVGGNGYPLLFQSGETWNSAPLVDRQHPHDFFAELSLGYTQQLNKDADVFMYVGYPGEPAISAPTFMHRPSSLNNPDAPLGHHWQDATHITFGVVTGGFRYKKFKIEGSSFTGREPGENRYNFDKARFDAWSGRLSYNPNNNWALQVSQAYIKSPEALHPNENIKRTTASLVYAKRKSNQQLLNAAAVWGYNYVDVNHKEHSALAEASYAAKKYTIYTRYEFVQKGVEELALDENIYGHNALFNVHAFTAGYARKIFSIHKTDLSLGAQATINFSDEKLKSIYGKTAVGTQVYLRISPAFMR